MIQFPDYTSLLCQQIELVKSRNNPNCISPLSNLLENRSIHLGGVRQSGKSSTLLAVFKNTNAVYIGNSHWFNNVDSERTIKHAQIRNLQYMSNLKPDFVLIDDAPFLFSILKPVKVYKKILEAFGDNVIIVAMH